MMVLKGRALGMWLNSDGSALITRINDLIKENRQSFLAPSIMWGYSKKRRLFYEKVDSH